MSYWKKFLKKHLGSKKVLRPVAVVLPPSLYLCHDIYSIFNRLYQPYHISIIYRSFKASKANFLAKILQNIRPLMIRIAGNFHPESDLPLKNYKTVIKIISKLEISKTTYCKYRFFHHVGSFSFVGIKTVAKVPILETTDLKFAIDKVFESLNNDLPHRKNSKFFLHGKFFKIPCFKFHFNTIENMAFRR